jgi:hypothetical protein
MRDRGGKMTMKRGCLAGVVLGCLVLGIASLAGADMVYWTDWSSVSYGNLGSASGTISFPGSPVDVRYSGEAISTGDAGDWAFPGTYSKAGVVDNTPTPRYESIMLTGGNSTVNTISFSSPVLNPVMGIQSLGNSGDPATYAFSSPFTIVQQGGGHWGGNAFGLTQDGNNLYGREGNGIIQFSGVFDSISWTVPDGEYYHMFTVGAPAVVTPLPAGVLLGVLGLGCAGVKLRRRS